MRFLFQVVNCARRWRSSQSLFSPLLWGKVSSRVQGANRLRKSIRTAACFAGPTSSSGKWFPSRCNNLSRNRCSVLRGSLRPELFRRPTRGPIEEFPARFGRPPRSQNRKRPTPRTIAEIIAHADWLQPRCRSRVHQSDWPKQSCSVLEIAQSLCPKSERSTIDR